MYDRDPQCQAAVGKGWPQLTKESLEKLNFKKIAVIKCMFLSLIFSAVFSLYQLVYEIMPDP